MKPENCMGCKYVSEKYIWCRKRISEGKPTKISLIEKCPDFIAHDPRIYLNEIPRGLMDEHELNEGTMILFFQLLETHPKRQNNWPFWFFFEPYLWNDYSDHMTVVDYMEHELFGEIIMALVYKLCGRAGPNRTLAIPVGQRKKFFATFGTYYTIATSAINKLLWKRITLVNGI